MDQRNERACIFKEECLPACWETVQRDKDERSTGRDREYDFRSLSGSDQTF